MAGHFGLCSSCGRALPLRRGGRLLAHESGQTTGRCPATPWGRPTSARPARPREEAASRREGYPWAPGLGLTWEPAVSIDVVGLWLLPLVIVWGVGRLADPSALAPCMVVAGLLTYTRLGGRL